MRLIIVLFCLTTICGQKLGAQIVDTDLLIIKKRLDSIDLFTAKLKLELDISFINMPTKNANITYVKGKPTKFSSNDFVIIPKQGLDFTLTKIFEYPFITVDRGMEKRNGKLYKAINVIPTDKRADFSIATLLLDTSNRRVYELEINTKKDGNYVLVMNYNSKEKLLPDLVEVNFEIERIKIPLNFVGKDTEVDRKKMKAKGVKTGKIYLRLYNYSIKLRNT
jgi:hypothetical protein